jgi:DNA polymerase-3 subunit gamma/tau
MKTTTSESLYRKYRPKNFDEVIGQSHVISTLAAAIKAKKIAHAYLFSGGRGIGKTSIARILARELGVTDKDLYEIDAASHRKIEDIHQIRESVASLPFESPYKVFILDEAHMLTREAWNALLKTLEEPPAHALFMLATTEIEKVPETILSRCEVYTLERPSRETLSQLVQAVSKKEGYTIDISTAEALALVGDGSFRDTLSHLQQVISATTGKKIDSETVEKVTGSPSHSTLSKLMDVLSQKNLDTALKLVQDAHAASVRADILLQELLQAWRAVLLARLSPSSKALIEAHYSPADFATIEARAKESPATSVFSAASLKILLAASATAAQSPLPHVALELALIEILS